MVSIDLDPGMYSTNIHNNVTDETMSQPQKRKLCKKDLREINSKRELAKIETAKLKHPFRDITCTDSCRMQCHSEELSLNYRQSIWTDFWSQCYTDRRKFLAKSITIKPIKRRTVVSSKDNFNRNTSRLYHLPTGHLHDQIRVCKSTFLNTFGYSNDSIVTELCKYLNDVNNSPCSSKVKENRGLHNNSKMFDRQVVIDHIKTFKPCSSHYRRHNSPNILYLPRELTVNKMYLDFCTKNGKCISQESYRSVLKMLNISLKKPNSDKCEDCFTFMNKIENSQVEDEIEVLKTKLEKHKSKASKANYLYKMDANINIITTRVYSMDLQKVLLLPILPESKTCFFTSRLVVFNETFASLKPKGNSICVLWHEAIAGRKGENITDSILALIEHERDAIDFIFWCDNCTGQNKNWILFTALVCILNSNHNSVESVTIKYLTKGHTHMSADGVHGNIETKIRKVRNIYDYDDLKNTIKASRQNLDIVDQKKFRQWTSKKRATNIKSDPLKNFKLGDIVMATFKRGSVTMFYSTDFDNENLQELDFLQKKFIKNITSYEPDIIISNRGIPPTKKKDIIEKLVPLMPANRELFWTELPVSLTSTDLVENIDLSDTFINECH